MTPKLKKVYDDALNDSEFCANMKLADDCFVPSFFSDEMQKIAFAGMYKGWLMKSIGVVKYNQGL